MQRLHKAFLLAKGNLALAREQQRAQYDKRARQQEFRVADKAPVGKEFRDSCTIPHRKKYAGKQTQLGHVNLIKPLYESMIWKEEPCVEFEDNRKEDTSPNISHELELTVPIDEERHEGNDVDLIDLHAEPLEKIRIETTDQGRDWELQEAK
ncbi:hypothetical protein OUZ56_012292 [Daphnia magna]|uniref:Uncharacterized protein n=1 Tax=Daphnia magna TaxID=35525 RepID=A0ABQ9Z2K2_9CRUS|nr:hypothetical protein OUZ56_012292 [Daphnia magna]